MPNIKKIKIAVAIDKPERLSPLSEVFGRSNFFLIYDLLEDSEDVLTNPFAKELGGAGIQSARYLIENNVDVLIVKKIGTNPFRFLTSADIEVYQCQGTNATEAIRLFTEGKLSLIENMRGDIVSGRMRKRQGRYFTDIKFINSKKGKI